jgi:hypothetical protein
MLSLKSQIPNSNWDRLIYLDQANGASVDLIVDNVTRKYSVSDLVSLVYHGPRPANCVSHVIDTFKPPTPDNVGWISADASLPDRTTVPTAKEIKRRMIRPKTAVKWEDLFSVNDDGALYLDGIVDGGEWKRYLIVDYLSASYAGPWPTWEAYALIINMANGLHPTNIAWMMQNPAYRNIYG